MNDQTVYIEVPSSTPPTQGKHLGLSEDVIMIMENGEKIFGCYDIEEKKWFTAEDDSELCFPVSYLCAVPLSTLLEQARSEAWDAASEYHSAEWKNHEFGQQHEIKNKEQYLKSQTT